MNKWRFLILLLRQEHFDLPAVRNLFPKDQAERIEKWVLKCSDSKDWGAYAIQELKEYGEEFQRAVENITNGGDPLSTIPIQSNPSSAERFR